MKTLALGALALCLVAAGCVTMQDPVTTASVDRAPDSLSTAGVFHTPGSCESATTTSGSSTATVSLCSVPSMAEGAIRAVGGQYHTGVSASEPTIGVTSDGAIFMTGSVPNPSCPEPAGGCPALPYANFQKGPTIMRSTDKGQTWEDVFPKLPTGDSYKLRSWDPYVYVDRATDRVFMDDIYPVGCGFMSWSDDGGGSWMHNPASCGNPQANDHQTIGTAKPREKLTIGYPNFVYRCVNNLVLTACAVSPNGGQTFLPQIPVAPESGCGGITGHLESDSEGRVFLPMTCGSSPVVAISEDDGTSWTIHTISEDHALHGLHVDMAVDEADNVYATWESDSLLWFSSSVDHGATWSEAIMVAAPDVTMVKFTAIAAGAPGKVAFAYVGTTQPDAPNLPGSECGAVPALPCSEPEEWKDATWNAYIGVMEDALAASPTIQTVTANDPADPLARGTCGGRCNGMTDFIDIAIDGEGRPWASFVDVCTAECVTDATVLWDVNVGFAGSLQYGPALRGDVAALPTLLPPP